MKIIVVKLKSNPEKYEVVQQIMKPPEHEKRDTGTDPEAKHISTSAQVGTKWLSKTLISMRGTSGFAGNSRCFIVLI